MSLILIVEDNEKNMKLARDVLQAKGYETVEAETGEEGVKLAKQRRPDLVLMDIQLPGINGIEAFRQIRGAITAAGFDAFISKPINLKEFLDTVKRLIERREAK
jgi:two-component system cell cycle response regulator DivK